MVIVGQIEEDNLEIGGRWRRRIGQLGGQMKEHYRAISPQAPPAPPHVLDVQ